MDQDFDTIGLSLCRELLKKIEEEQLKDARRYRWLVKHRRYALTHALSDLPIGDIEFTDDEIAQKIDGKEI